MNMCPHCGWLTPATGLIPVHGWMATRQECPGSDQNPRNPESDGRPLWNGKANPHFPKVNPHFEPEPERGETMNPPAPSPLKTASRAVNSDLNEVAVHDKYGRPILTVGVLRSLMEGINDDAHVAFDDCDGWYRNISVVAIPDDPDGDACEGYSALTFLAGEPLDPRQF